MVVAAFPLHIDKLLLVDATVLLKSSDSFAIIRLITMSAYLQISWNSQRIPSGKCKIFLDFSQTKTRKIVGFNLADY